MPRLRRPRPPSPMITGGVAASGRALPRGRRGGFARSPVPRELGRRAGAAPFGSSAARHLDHLVLRWLGKGDEMRDFTYADLRERSNRFANVLQGLGVASG